MTTSDHGVVNLRRVNRSGHPCPTWCRTDHSELLIPGKPSYGHMDGHYSDPVARPPGSPGAVRLSLDPRDAAPVMVTLDPAPGVTVRLTPEQAAAMAHLIEADGTGNPRQLSAELRAASLIARQSAS
jgi:hypothetical protein